MIIEAVVESVNPTFIHPMNYLSAGLVQSKLRM